MTVETAPNFTCWTSTQAGVRWLIRNFIRWPLFFTLLRKSACGDVGGIFQSIETLSEIFFDAPHGPCHWFCGEFLVISNKYNSCVPWQIMQCTYLEYFMVRGKLGPDSQLGQMATIDFLLWDFLGSYTSDASNDHMAALAVQCKETW